MEILVDILTNMLSELVFLVLIVVLSIILYRKTKRTRLLRFFGIQKSKRIVVYLSNLQVQKYGAAGADGIKYSYEGNAAPFGEMRVANSFRSLFNYFIPSLSDYPGILSNILLSDVDVHLEPSPENSTQLEPSTSFITFGSPAFNAISRLVENELHSQIHFGVDKIPVQNPGRREIQSTVDLGEQSDEINLSTSASGVSLDWLYSSMEQSDPVSNVPQHETGSQAEPIKLQPVIVINGVAPIADDMYGFVERIVDHERSIFYAAGLSESGTVGAAHFLATEWERLEDDFGHDKPFVVMLRIDRADHRRWDIVFKR